MKAHDQMAVRHAAHRPQRHRQRRGAPGRATFLRPGSSRSSGNWSSIPGRVLSEDDVAEVILRDEIADRRDTIEQYLRAGRDAPAAELQGQNEVLERYL